jgi:hypothetical protein
MTVARVTEITASSKKGVEAAIEEGLKRASKTLKGITGVEVAAIKARVERGRIKEYRVSLKIAYVLEG